MGVGAAKLLRVWPTLHQASKGIPGPLCRRVSPLFAPTRPEGPTAVRGISALERAAFH